MGKPSRKDRQALAIVVAAVITAVASVWGLWITSRTDSSEASTPTGSPTSFIEVSVKPSSPETRPEVTASGIESAGSQAVKTAFLDSLKPIDDDLDTESVSWQGETFSHSLVNPLSGCSSVGPVVWEIPAGMAMFRTEIGVDTSSMEQMATVTFNVYLDETPVASRTLPVGAHEPMDIAMDGASVIKIESIIDENRRTSCGADAVAVWGDPRFESAK